MQVKYISESLANIFKNCKDMHLALDEAKFFICTAVQKKIKESTPDWIQGRDHRANEYKALFNMINDCYQKLGDPNKSMILFPKYSWIRRYVAKSDGNFGKHLVYIYPLLLVCMKENLKIV